MNIINRATNTLPEYVKYFTELCIQDDLTLDECKPPIENVISLSIEPEVVSTNLINTPIGFSNAGQNLTGKKLIVELRLKEKLKYVALEKTQPVNMVYFDNFMKSVFIILPETLDGENICSYIRKKRFNVIPYVENVYFRKVDEKTVFRCVTILVDVQIF